MYNVVLNSCRVRPHFGPRSVLISIGELICSTRMMDPVVLYYGKGQLSGFLADPAGVLDVVSSYAFPKQM